jgi:hypothetical protein
LHHRVIHVVVHVDVVVIAVEAREVSVAVAETVGHDEEVMSAVQNSHRKSSVFVELRV